MNQSETTKLINQLKQPVKLGFFGVVWKIVACVLAVPMFGILLFPKVPVVICQWLGRIQLLPILGLLYTTTLTVAALYVFDIYWAGILCFYCILIGAWLPPGPFSFVFRPRVRKAVRIAIEFLQNDGGHKPAYDDMTLIDLNDRCCDLAIMLRVFTMPSTYRYLRVDFDSGEVVDIPLEEILELGIGAKI